MNALNPRINKVTPAKADVFGASRKQADNFTLCKNFIELQ